MHRHFYTFIFPWPTLGWSQAGRKCRGGAQRLSCDALMFRPYYSISILSPTVPLLCFLKKCGKLPYGGFQKPGAPCDSTRQWCYPNPASVTLLLIGATGARSPIPDFHHA